MKQKKMFGTFMRDDSGAALLEYSLTFAIIATGFLIVLSQYGVSLGSIFGPVGDMFFG